MSFVKLFEQYHDDFDETLEAAHMLSMFDGTHSSDYEIVKLFHGVEKLDKDVAELFIIYVNGELYPETIAPSDYDYNQVVNKEGWTPQNSDKFPKCVPLDEYNKVLQAGLYNIEIEHRSYVVFESSRNVYSTEIGKSFMTLDKLKSLTKDLDEKWEYFKHIMPLFYKKWTLEWR